MTTNMRTCPHSVDGRNYNCQQCLNSNAGQTNPGRDGVPANTPSERGAQAGNRERVTTPGRPSGGNARPAGQSQSGQAGAPRQSAPALAGPGAYTATQGPSTGNVSSTGYPQALPYRQVAPNQSQIGARTASRGQSSAAPNPADAMGYITHHERMSPPAHPLHGGDREEYRPARNAPAPVLVHGYDLSGFLYQPTADFYAPVNTPMGMRTHHVFDDFHDGSGEQRRDNVNTGAEHSAPSSVRGIRGGSNGNPSSNASENERRATDARRHRR